jgi:hypothetical protein
MMQPILSGFVAASLSACAVERQFDETDLQSGQSSDEEFDERDYLVGPAAPHEGEGRSDEPVIAGNYFCSDSNGTPPNDIDTCFVGSRDYGVSYIAEVTANESPSCNFPRHTQASIRVRILGDRTEDKLRVRRVSVRYLSGSRPWMWIRLSVLDGNNDLKHGPWNNHGGWIPNDGAGRDVENTINLTPHAGYAPTLGANRAITFSIIMIENSTIPMPFPTTSSCMARNFNVQFVPSSIP